MKGPFQKILVAVDGSEHSRHTLDLAVQLARCSGGSLLLVHAQHRIADFIGEPYYQTMLDRLNAQTRELLAPCREQLQQAGLSFEERILQGDPAEHICSVARVEDCDVIVMGSRGRSNVAGLVLGSVSHKVLSTAPCPVLTVR